MSATVCGCELRDGSWVNSAVNDDACRYPALLEAAEGVRELVDRQAEDDGLWFVAATAPEAYLQQEFRKLHAWIENALRAEVARANAAPGREG